MQLEGETDGEKVISQVTAMFYIPIGLCITQVYVSVKTHQMIDLGLVCIASYVICKQYWTLVNDMNAKMLGMQCTDVCDDLEIHQK